MPAGSAASAPGPKESADPDKDVKLDRIEYVTSHYRDRYFTFDQFGPLSIRPLARRVLGAAQTPGPAARGPTTARTASATSTAATAWAMTGCKA
jgi:hypothetical protein